jgi:hypothetical protein
LGTLSGGWHDYPICLEGVTNGLYFVVVEIQGQKFVKKWMVLR